MATFLNALLKGLEKAGKGIEILTNVNPEQELRARLYEMGLTDEQIDDPSPDAELIDRFIVGGGFTKTAVRSKLAREAGKGVLEVGEQVVKKAITKPKVLADDVYEMAQRFAAKTGFDVQEVFKAMKPRIIGKEITPIVNEALKQGGIKMWLKAHKKGIIKGVTGLVGADLIFNWFMNDNAPFLVGQNLRKLDEGIKEGNMNPIEAEKLMNDGDKLMRMAELNALTGWRQPILWPFVLSYQEGIKLAKKNNQLTKDDITAAADKQREKELSEAESEQERTFRGKTFETSEERLAQEKSFMRAEEKQERIKQQKLFAEEQARKEAEWKARQKDKASMGVRALAQTPYEQKKREVPSKLGFGL